MGRHSTPIRIVWSRLPEKWRAHIRVWRRAWRAWSDRRHTPKGEWDAHLPRDPSMWSDAWDHGSYNVAATLRKNRRQRGDLLPERHQETR